MYVYLNLQESDAYKLFQIDCRSRWQLKESLYFSDWAQEQITESTE